MKTKSPTAPSASLAATVAGDDLKVGEYVAVLYEVKEYLSLYWEGGACQLPPHETVRVPFTPSSAGEPLKVEAICLPFVFVKTACGEHRSLDIRMARLARLDQEYAKFVLKKTRKKASPLS